MADGTFCSRSLAGLRRPRSGEEFSSTSRNADSFVWSWDAQRNLRWGRTLYTARVHRAGVDRCRSVEGVACNDRLTRILFCHQLLLAVTDKRSCHGRPVLTIFCIVPTLDEQ